MQRGAQPVPAIRVPAAATSGPRARDEPSRTSPGRSPDGPARTGVGRRAGPAAGERGARPGRAERSSGLAAPSAPGARRPVPAPPRLRPGLAPLPPARRPARPGPSRPRTRPSFYRLHPDVKVRSRPLSLGVSAGDDDEPVDVVDVAHGTSVQAPFDVGAQWLLHSPGGRRYAGRGAFGSGPAGRLRGGAGGVGAAAARPGLLRPGGGTSRVGGPVRSGRLRVGVRGSGHAAPPGGQSGRDAGRSGAVDACRPPLCTGEGPGAQPGRTAVRDRRSSRVPSQGSTERNPCGPGTGERPPSADSG